MTRVSAWKATLTLAGVLSFLTGIRTGSELLRWTGISLVSAAWLLRFVGKGAARPAHDPVTSSEES